MPGNVYQAIEGELGKRAPPEAVHSRQQYPGASVPGSFGERLKLLLPSVFAPADRGGQESRRSACPGFVVGLDRLHHPGVKDRLILTTQHSTYQVNNLTVLLDCCQSDKRIDRLKAL